MPDYELTPLGYTLVFLVAGLLYLLPTFIAAVRRHRNSYAIFGVNLLLGWTAVGWLVALVWSFVGAARDQRAPSGVGPSGERL